MPNAFFDKLVSDRRDGIAPPQLEAAEPAGGAAPLVVFHPAPFDGLSTCGRCLALLVTEHAPAHAQWHREAGA